MSPSELQRIEGEDVGVRRHLHVLDPCHLALGVQAAAERRPRNGDLRCEQRRRGSLPDDKSSVPYSSNTAVKIGHTPESRRGDVTHPRPEGGGVPRHTSAERGGGSPATHQRREEASLTAPHGGPAATDLLTQLLFCSTWLYPDAAVVLFYLAIS